jgi:uncharacterized protein YbjT (DUF2867 family)
MKLLILGATGSVGRHLVEQALAQGHLVTAFVRNSLTTDLPRHPALQLIQGDVLDYLTVEKAMSGQHAVLCTIGAGRKGFVRAEGTRIILRAMAATDVNRIIVQSTLGVGDSWQNLTFFWKYIMFSLLLRDAFADHQQQEKYVRESHTDWTIVRPAAFTDGNRTGLYKQGFPANDRRITAKISRADVADFMLKQLDNDMYYYKTPGLSY